MRRLTTYCRKSSDLLIFSCKILLLATCLIAVCQLSAQSKLGFENYNYWGQQSQGTFVPLIHFETNKNWYAELRYNYEDAQTISFYAGKTFSGGNDLTYSIIPLAGFSYGRFTGASIAANTEVEWKKFYISSQSQYSVGLRKETPDFFFTWSELGYNISDHVYAGGAIQYTWQLNSGAIEPGFVVGINFKKFSVPFYVFNPFKQSSYLVLGLNYEYDLKRRK